MWSKKEAKKYMVKEGYDVPTWRGVVRWLFTDMRGRKPTKLQWVLNIAVLIVAMYLISR
jgi:hypothetical protein